MPEELDAFDTAAAEADAEVSAESAVEQAPVTDTPQTTETAAEVAPTVEAPSGDAVAQPTSQVATEAPWWEGKLGEEIEYKGVRMRLEDALAGGLRQADYTKKTTELAQRGRIADWGEETLRGLRDDPVSTLRKLAADAGLIPKGQQDFDPQEEPDPALVEIQQVKEQFGREIDDLRAARLVEETRQEIAQARSKYPDFNDEVLTLIVEYGNERNIGLSMEDGYWLWKAKQFASQEAARAKAQTAAQKEADTLAAARAAAAATSTGHPAATLTDERDYGGKEGGDLFDAIAEDVWGSLENA